MDSFVILLSLFVGAPIIFIVIYLSNEKNRIENNKQAETDENIEVNILDKERGMAIENVNGVMTPAKKLAVNISNKISKNIASKLSHNYLTSTSWILVGDNPNHVLFTFRDKGQLIITENGNVTKGDYDLIAQNKSIIISKNKLSEHFYFLNVYDNYFFLNKISTSEVIVFVNHELFKDDLRREFLDKAINLKKSLGYI